MTSWSDALVPDEQLALAKYDLPDYTGVRARLDANECALPLDAHISAELGAWLGTLSVNRYPDSEATQLRRVVSASLGVALDQLSFGNGSQDAIMLVIAAFSRPRPGASRAVVMYPEPTFVGYTIAAHINGVVPVGVPLRADFTLDISALDAAAATHRPNIVFFALPNNPTGTMWERAQVLDFAARHRDTVVIADEAYVEYSGETAIDALSAHPNLVILRTLTKLGLAAIRVGYLAGAPELIAHVDKIRPPFNVGGLNQAAAAWLLEHHAGRLRELVAIVVAERVRLEAELARIPEMVVFPSRSNFILCRYGTAGDGRAGALCAQLERERILVRNFDAPGLLSGCFRVTVGTAAENTLFLEVLRGLVARR